MSKSTTKPEATHVDDLRKVFLQVDEGPTTPGDVVQANEGINSRYARELLATLAEVELIVNTEDPESPDSEAFQINARIEDFEKWAGTAKAKPAKRAANTKDEGAHPCYCGCGENVPSKSFYRPGHDARHAGVVGREIAANYATKGFDRRDLLSNLPSEKLVAKAELIAEKAIERAEKKATDKGETTPFEEGTVKVGKTERVAQRSTKHGDVTYLDDKGEWKPASKAATKTFTVG